MTFVFAIVDLAVWTYILVVMMFNLIEWPVNYSLPIKIVHNFASGVAAVFVFVKMAAAFDTLSALIGSVPL